MQNNYCHAHRVKCRKGTLVTWRNCVWRLWLTCFDCLGFLTVWFFSPHLKPRWVFKVCRKAHQVWQAGWAHYLVHGRGRALSVPTLWSTCTMCDSLWWILNKTKPLLHCNCCILRCLSLFLFPCFILSFPPLPLPFAFCLWMEQQMNLGSSSWVRRHLTYSVFSALCVSCHLHL